MVITSSENRCCRKSWERQPWPGQRNLNMESIYEYGSRAGFWRLWRMFTESQGVTATVYGVTACNGPQSGGRRGDEGSRLGNRQPWLPLAGVQGFFRKTSSASTFVEAVRLHTELTGQRPYGMYQGKPSDNTLRLVHGGGRCSSIRQDSYADDLPYWVKGVDDKPFLIIPYTLETNDMRFATPQGFNSGDQFFTYLKDAFDTLYEEGKAGNPKMMSVGLHCRLVGRPGRAAALKRFIEYVLKHDNVWIPRRIEIAEHWHKNHKQDMT